MKNFKINVLPAIENGFDSKEFSFETKAEMIAALNSMADLLLFLQDDIGVMEDFSNSFCLTEYIDGNWTEIEE